MTVTALVIAIADPVRAQLLLKMVEAMAEEDDMRRTLRVMKEHYPEEAATLDAIFAKEAADGTLTL